MLDNCGALYSILIALYVHPLITVALEKNVYSALGWNVLGS